MNEEIKPLDLDAELKDTLENGFIKEGDLDLESFGLDVDLEKELAEFANSNNSEIMPRAQKGKIQP